MRFLGAIRDTGICVRYSQSEKITTFRGVR